MGVMIWLQSHERYDVLGQFDPNEGTIQLTSKAECTAPMPEPQGLFSELGGGVFAVYRRGGKLFLWLVDRGIEFDDAVRVEIHGSPESRRLEVCRNEKLLRCQSYRLNSQPDDSRDSKEAEELDFGLFLCAISRDPIRKARLRGENPEMPPPVGEVTQLLHAVSMGDKEAENRLYSLVYEDLRRTARGWFKKLPEKQILQPTALVHETYMKLLRKAEVSWENRAHFYKLAARVMHDLLVDLIRQMKSLRRGGGKKPRDLADMVDPKEADLHEVLAVSEAMTKLKEEEPEIAEVVNLRFFAGMTGDETAKALGVSPSTVDRHWRYARAWLHRELHPDQ